MIPTQLYYVCKVKTKTWFRCFDVANRNKPVWTNQIADALVVHEVEGLKLLRRLDNLYAPRQPIKLVKKI